jgi:hypothetical protein
MYEKKTSSSIIVLIRIVQLEIKRGIFNLRKNLIICLVKLGVAYSRPHISSYVLRVQLQLRVVCLCQNNKSQYDDDDDDDDDDNDDDDDDDIKVHIHVAPGNYVIIHKTNWESYVVVLEGLVWLLNTPLTLLTAWLEHIMQSFSRYCAFLLSGLFKAFRFMSLSFSMVSFMIFDRCTLFIDPATAVDSMCRHCVVILEREMCIQ